jgi:hypothetical protein
MVERSKGLARGDRAWRGWWLVIMMVKMIKEES